ncbi:MAG: hypothetical protein IJ489_05370 [Clostridia bacterium]|nr:hypothetical protein [Clostridia bacterium]
MNEKMPIEGKYLMYKGKPLLREKNWICYGNMTDKYYLSMLIINNKTVNGKEVPNSILVQILTTGTDTKIYKQITKVGLADALDIGTIWLERALSDSAT